jgi:site-specific DNA recombinase
MAAAAASLRPLTHKGQAHDGLHDPIVDQETWDRVQLLLEEHAQRTAGNCQCSDALLAGKLFDDRGNRMSPSNATIRLVCIVTSGK